MRLSALRLALAALLVSSLTACTPGERAVFDASAVPAPPAYSPAFKRALAAEISAAPHREKIIRTLMDASGFYDRIRRLKGETE